MGEGGSGAAAVQVDDASALAAGENDAPVEGVAALCVEQAETLQEIPRIALSGEMPAQACAGGIADAQLFDQGGIVQSSLLQIVQRLRVANELLLIKSGGLLEDGGRIGWKSVLLEVNEAFAEGQMTGQLDKAKKIAALTATVAVEEIFASVDIERRAGIPVQGTAADELGTMTCRSRDPVLLPQIIEQRKALFEFFDVLAHGAVLPLGANVGESRQYSQARMVGRGKFLRDARAREFAEPKSAKTKAQLRNRQDHHTPAASEWRGRAFGGEK